jgi:hypothetical protein
MGTSDSSGQRQIRRDGWTIERQLAFLDSLVRTRSVARSARSVGMSRESAYRLRARPQNGLLAAQWDRILASAPRRPETQCNRSDKSHAARRFQALLAALRQGKSAKGHETDEADAPPSSLDPARRS